MAKCIKIDCIEKWNYVNVRRSVCRENSMVLNYKSALPRRKQVRNCARRMRSHGCNNRDVRERVQIGF